MLLASDFDSIRFDASVAAIGAYDGFHIGHRSILVPMIAGARRRKLPTVLVTFSPLPAVFFGRLPVNSRLLLPEEGAEFAAALGLDAMISVPFDRSLADQSADAFLRRLAGAIGMKELRVGEGFSLGKNREGRERVLAGVAGRYGFDLIVHPRLRLPDGEISSTRIRAFLRDGDVSNAKRLLGYPFFIRNTILHGVGLGTKIGIPTLNLRFPDEKIVLANGVYVTRTELDGVRYDSVTAIGVRPTFYDKSDLTIESYLLDASVDGYGKVARIDFHAFIRPEMKFSNSGALVRQVGSDIDFARGYLATLPLDADFSSTANDFPYQVR